MNVSNELARQNPKQVSSSVTSWGRVPRTQQIATAMEWRDDPLPVADGLSLLPHGMGRSYGDSCLNDGGAVILTERLNRFISFDRATGVLRAESGVTLADILLLAVPQGWFLPVTPGTKFVTLGGAIANDVHGKNHHRAGTFGGHVRAFELARSDGTRRVCSPADHSDWFAATIGGLGLTGLITWAEVQLKPINNPFITQETIRFRDLSEFFEVNAESESDFEYTVSWIDCLARGRSLGRGIYIRGDHSGPQLERALPVKHPPRLAVPFDAPSFVLGSSLFHSTFNTLFYNKHIPRKKAGLTGIDPFFYPLDGVHGWNRAYGSRGFFQYQLVIPFKDQREVSRELFEVIAKSRQASFLCVFKTFGTVPSPGLLSFPRPGVTLALDFPNRGVSTLELFKRLDEIVEQAGGALYPAKDARMSGASFRRAFPNWERLVPYIDPRFSSSFWRRVTAPKAG